MSPTKRLIRPFNRYEDIPKKYTQEVFFPALLKSPVPGYGGKEPVYYSPKAIRTLKRNEVLIPITWWQAHRGKTGMTRWAIQPPLGMSDRRFRHSINMLYTKQKRVNFEYCGTTACPIYTPGWRLITQYDFDYSFHSISKYTCVLDPSNDPCYPFGHPYDYEAVYPEFNTFKECYDVSEAGEVERMYMQEFGSPEDFNLERSRKFDPRGCASVPTPTLWKQLQEQIDWVRNV